MYFIVGICLWSVSHSLSFPCHLQSLSLRIASSSFFCAIPVGGNFWITVIALTLKLGVLSKRSLNILLQFWHGTSYKCLFFMWKIIFIDFSSAFWRAAPLCGQISQTLILIIYFLRSGVRHRGMQLKKKKLYWVVLIYLVHSPSCKVIVRTFSTQWGKHSRKPKDIS